MNILLTGGAGYIGSHTIIELDKAGHSVVVVDNLANSNPESLRRVAKIIGKRVIYRIWCAGHFRPVPSVLLKMSITMEQ